MNLRVLLRDWLLKPSKEEIAAQEECLRAMSEFWAGYYATMAKFEAAVEAPKDAGELN